MFKFSLQGLHKTFLVLPSSMFWVQLKQRVWLIDWMVFYAAFNSISVISWQQLTLFMSFLGFTSTRLGLWSVLPKDTPTKKPRGSSAARTQDPWITSQMLYHWAALDPWSKGGVYRDTSHTWTIHWLRKKSPFAYL